MRKSILYVVPPTDSFAGIERVTHEIANGFVDHHGEAVDVTVLFCSDLPALQSIDARYELLNGHIDRLWKVVPLVRRLLRARRFDVVVVSQVEAATLVWLSGVPKSTKLVIWLHGNPFIERRSTKSAVLFALFERIAAKRFSAAFVVAPSQKVYFDDIKCLKDHVSWVPNPVRTFTTPTVVRHRTARPVRFVSVGRLVHQKGYDNLIRAFAIASDALPRATLEIVGYGPEQERLASEIDTLKLEHKVLISNLGSNPEAALANADIFVSSSRWEGWSLVIVEALSFGLPVIAMDCDFGPRDILTDSRLGALVQDGDVAALAQRMQDFAASVEFNRRHAEYRKQHASRFRLSEVLARHIAAIDGLSAARV